MILYHGTTKEFDAFDKSKAKTSKHIYTTPDIRTASYYGSNIYELEIVGEPKVANLFDDHRLIEKLSEIFWEDFADEALIDADIQTAIGILVQTDPSIDEEWEAEEHPTIKAMIEREAKRLFAQTLSDGLSFGRVGTMGSMQDAILDELFGMGFDAVEIPDSSSVGSPVSVVWNDPSMIRPKKLLSTDEKKAAPYYQMESYFDILARQINEQHISEYVRVLSPVFKPIDFSNAQHVGNIGSGAGPLSVWRLVSENEVAYGAVLGTTPTDIVPVSMIVCLDLGNNYMMAKNAWTDPDYRGKGIQSNLFLYVNKTEKNILFSDTHMSDDGVKLWKSMETSGRFNIKIANLATSQSFDITEMGQVADDGSIVVDPKHDDAHDHLWNGKNGQKYFWMMESIKRFSLHENQRPYENWDSFPNRNLKWSQHFDFFRGNFD